jgi:hypothetical protein
MEALMNNHKVRNNPGSYFYGNTNMNLLCGNGIVGDALSKDMHSFYLSPTIPHLNRHLTKLKAKNVYLGHCGVEQ